MLESELDDLESQIDKLIESYQQVKLENNALHKKITSLSKENLVLLDKKEKAAAAMKKLIMQLQDKLLCQTQKST